MFVCGGCGDIIIKELGKYVELIFSLDGKMVVYCKVFGGSIFNLIWLLELGIYLVSVKGGDLIFIIKLGY